MNHRKNSTATGGAVAADRDALMGTSEQQSHYMPSQCACQPTVVSDDSH
jgi:hypothetical protein